MVTFPNGAAAPTGAAARIGVKNRDRLKIIVTVPLAVSY
jgi:hypothetical protein